MIATVPLSGFFRALADPVRLRILHLLHVEELTVSELVRILDLPQSSVSRHLKVLRDAGLVSDRPLGAASFYRAVLEADGPTTGLRDALAATFSPDELSPADRDALARVLASRSDDAANFFDRVGAHWDALREECFGPTFHLEAFIHLLPREWTVADLGSGTGYLLPPLANHFRRVIGVDASAQMVTLAQRRVRDAGVANAEVRMGELNCLPIADAEVDLALLVLMLHHVADVGGALREVARIVRPSGRVLIVELHPHENELFRVRMADRRPGIAPAALQAWLAEAGFGDFETWNYPANPRPEHELTPIPSLYGVVARLKEVCTHERATRSEKEK
jgi:ArsR family transcriptional regulator